MNNYYGYNAPFQAGNQGILSRQVNERLIKNDLLQLLLTAPGERVMRPTFGTPIRRFVFEQLTTADLAALRSGIIEAITQFEQRVVVDDVKLDVDDNNNLLSIAVLGTFSANRINPASFEPSTVLVQYNIPTKSSNRLN